MSIFATHPPLEQRIAAIEPNWDGRFVSAKPRHSARQAAAANAANAAKAAKSKAAPMQAHDFINSIGQVGAAAILSAQEIHGQIGQDLERLHKSRDAACAVLIGLQITASAGADDAEQLSLVKARVDGAVYREAEAWLPRLRELDLNQRFALFDAALPMAVARDLDGFASLSALVKELAHSDGSIELEELALLRGMAAYLQARRQPSRQVKPLPPADMEMPLCVLLSAITYTASTEAAARETAFQAGARKCNRYLLHQSILLPEADITFEALEAALDLFMNLPLPQKKVIFEGALAVVLADGKVAQEELSLVRVIAASLGLPMPPLMSETL